MKPSKVELIYYSPTGTSKKVLEGVAKGLGVRGVEQIDLTPFEAATNSHSVPAARVEVKVPGNKPYKERNPIPIARAPDTTAETCTLCGACAEVCPTKAVTVTDRVETVKESCSACSACVKACPTGARVWTNEGVKRSAVWLAANCSVLREPEFFV